MGDLDSTGLFADYSPKLTLEIPAETRKVSFTVAILEDNLVEDVETTYILLSSVTFPADYSKTGGINFWERTFTLVVEDDDSGTLSNRPTFSFYLIALREKAIPPKLILFL